MIAPSRLLRVLATAALAWLGLWLPAAQAAPTDGTADGGIDSGKPRSVRPFDIALVTPVNIFHPPNKVIAGLSINALYGRNPRVYGLEVGALINRTDEAVGGIQVAGLMNWNTGVVRGLSIAGVVNAGKNGECRALCIAAGANIHERIGGAQLSLTNVAGSGRGLMIGMLNHVRTDYGGLQIGLFNWNNYLYTERRIDSTTVEVTTYHWKGKNKALQLGMQNIAHALAGAQIGAFNTVRKEIRGGQVFGAWNHAGKELHGFQLGAINSGGEVHGVQLGVINITRRLHGLQVGALNIATKNRVPFMIGALYGGKNAARRR